LNIIIIIIEFSRQRQEVHAPTNRGSRLIMERPIVKSETMTKGLDTSTKINDANSIAIPRLL